MKNPTFHNPVAETLINAIFSGSDPRDRRILMKGAAQFPTTKEHLELCEQVLASLHEDAARLATKIKDYETVIAVAKTIAIITDGAEGPNLLDWHDE